MRTTANQVVPPVTALGKRAVIIIGMHRSGTSAATGALKCLGVDLGGKLYRGHQQINAKGYFEHSDIAETNDEILWRLGSAKLQQAAQEIGNQAPKINSDDLCVKLREIQRNFPLLLVEQLQSVTHKRGQLGLTVHRLVRFWYWYVGKPVRFVERLLG